MLKAEKIKINRVGFLIVERPQNEGVEYVFGIPGKRDPTS